MNRLSPSPWALPPPSSPSHWGEGKKRRGEGKEVPINDIGMAKDARLPRADEIGSRNDKLGEELAMTGWVD